MKCPPTVPLRDATRALAVESEHAAWLAAHRSVPGVEVHVEPDATWMIQPGGVWSNAVVQARFDARTVETRLDRLLTKYRATKRGVGFWVSPLVTPEDLTRRLQARGLRCRKHYPAMHCDLATLDAKVPRVSRLTIEPLQDYGMFTAHPHPYFGRISTAMRRFELARSAHLNERRPRRTWDLIALRDAVPVGACTLFFHEDVVGIHDVGVLASVRGQGIGTALVRYACEFARLRGAVAAALIASSEGFGVYSRAGFSEVARIGYWYRRYAPG